jgi:coiled-coil domain-containing protein 61
MTKKTGNFKKFSIFIEMLLSAFDKSTKTVSLELLSMKDLQHKQGNDSGKIYLIVTYAVAFDRFNYLLVDARVHYPLPLQLNDGKSYQELLDKLRESETERLASVQELSLVLLFGLTLVDYEGE